MTRELEVLARHVLREVPAPADGRREAQQIAQVVSVANAPDVPSLRLKPHPGWTIDPNTTTAAACNNNEEFAFFFTSAKQ